jgi:uncharacterized membrane protein
MNTKVKKGVFWGVMAAAIILGINVLTSLLGGTRTFAAGPHGHGGHGGMGPRGGGGFDAQPFMNGPHHDGGFPWLGLLVGLAVLFFLVRWLRKKAKTSSMTQFIETPVAGSHIPTVNQNGNLLDQWEKNISTKKENE